MTRLRDVVSFLDETLEIDRFRDYGPNGLQVEGAGEVRRVVTGVSACARLFERAIAARADLIVVHHGLIWGGGLRAITGIAGRRIAQLVKNDISLAAYHLPLDDHPRLGNNVGLCDAIGLGAERERFGEVRGRLLGMMGRWPEALSRAEAIARIALGVLGDRAVSSNETAKGTGGPPSGEQSPHFVFPHGPDQVRTVGLCTGAASDLLEEAALAGCDLYLTGELAERAGELARELGINLVAAGHHATEVFGPRRVADELSRCFPDLSVQFIDVPSPL